MTIVESKLKTGILELGPDPGTDFACQASNVRIVPKHDESGDPLETLCGDSLGADTIRSDTLNITAVQDFTDPDGFVLWTWENDLVAVAFSWTPSATSPTFTGTVQVRALEIGGDVNKRLTTDAEWSIQGAVTVVPLP